jgi:hypothetical protein
MIELIWKGLGDEREREGERERERQREGRSGPAVE